MNQTQENCTRLEFLHTILRPLTDTYACSAMNLKKLVDQPLCERDLIQEVLNDIKTNLDQGTVSYGECYNFALHECLLEISLY